MYPITTFQFLVLMGVSLLALALGRKSTAAWGVLLLLAAALTLAAPHEALTPMPTHQPALQTAQHGV